MQSAIWINVYHMNERKIGTKSQQGFLKARVRAFVFIHIVSLPLSHFIHSTTMFKKPGDVVERNKSQLRKKEVRKASGPLCGLHVWKHGLQTMCHITCRLSY